MVFVGDTNSANPLFRAGSEVGESGQLRISNEAARQLGLADQQVVKGLLDRESGTIRLSTDTASMAFYYRQSAYNPVMIWFRVSQSAYGAVLRPLPHEDSTTTERSRSSSSPPTASESSAGLSRQLLLMLASRPSLATIWSQLYAQGHPDPQRQMLQQEFMRLRELLPRAADLDVAAIRTALTGMSASAPGAAAPGLLKALWQSLSGRRQPGPDARNILDLSEVLQPLQEYLDSARIESLLNQEQGRLVARFPLFFADAPPVEISLTGQGNARHEGGAGWRLDLEMLLPDGAQLWLNCLFDSSWDVQATAWTTNQQLAIDMRRNARELQNNLASFGLQLRSLQVVPEARPPGSGSPFQGLSAAQSS
jgi:hypothetical protein